jgi:hypothetical protein
MSNIKEVVHTSTNRKQIKTILNKLSMFLNDEASRNPSITPSPILSQRNGHTRVTTFIYCTLSNRGRGVHVTV